MRLATTPAYVCVLLGLVISGCSSDSSNKAGASTGTDTGTGTGTDTSTIGGSGSEGQVTDAWNDYCVATFTSNFAIVDSAGAVAFIAKAGERYLLTAYNDFWVKPRVQIAYLTASGPSTYDVPVAGGPETFPFTSNCTYDAAVEYYAAFLDTTVYDSEALTNAICTIPAGTLVQRDTTDNADYMFVAADYSGPQTCYVMLNAFSSMCQGAREGYISVPETTLLGGATWLVPIRVVLKPT